MDFRHRLDIDDIDDKMVDEDGYSFLAVHGMIHIEVGVHSLDHTTNDRWCGRHLG